MHHEWRLGALFSVGGSGAVDTARSDRSCILGGNFTNLLRLQCRIWILTYRVDLDPLFALSLSKLVQTQKEAVSMPFINSRMR